MTTISTFTRSLTDKCDTYFLESISKINPLQHARFYF
jgi:hypothetical protein